MTDVDERWLRRIDGHMERGNELFERFVDADDRNRAAFDRNTAAFARWESQQNDMHDFMREITQRVELAGREHTRAIRRMSDEMAAEFKEIRTGFNGIFAEMRAGRGAFLAVLDRLPPPASDAPG